MSIPVFSKVYLCRDDAQTWPSREPSLLLDAVLKECPLFYAECRRGAELQSKQVVEAEWCGDLTLIQHRAACCDRRSCFGPMAHGVGCRRIGRISIAAMHSRLILHRPAVVRLQSSQDCFIFPVFRCINANGIEPQHINIAARTGRRILMEIVPHRVSDKSSSYPAIREAEGPHDFENVPSE